ncbi:tetratricopeptide repeat protein [Sphingobium ummariense]|uniref:Tetratricopeptide repeat protein n=1 Tax=Sphingobium ummariense RL-3 TaxID=1346791 RepID=T0J4U7_9SPHN|nr:tetratricopeptide repeat protein [Sphingobium ummariense]EQB31857.1 hypothetical protein M529_12510 [Sphingobium ummariense RL-3]
MRSAILFPLALALAAPVHAQHVAGVSGIHFNNSTPFTGPVGGFASGYVPRQAPNSEIGQAQALIAAGQYGQADAVLTKLIGATSSKYVRFLKGVTKLGLGDAEAARRYFEKSLYQGRNGYPGAMSGLAIAEIQLGNRDAAEHILEKLRYQQDKCGRSCDRAKSLEQAVGVVEKALI